MKFLNNPDSLHDDVSDPFFKMPTKTSLVNTARSLMERLFKTPESQPTDEENNVSENSQVEELSLEKRLEAAIQSQVTSIVKPTDDYYKSLLKEFNLYTATGKITPNLTMLFDALKTIRPTSIESERAFSALGLFVTKIRSRLSCKAVDMLSFLKSYYKNK